MEFTVSVTREISRAEARRIAKQYGVRLPRIGYEMSLGDGRWLSSTGHAQFGWFGSHAKQPFTITCRCDETLRPGEPRGCAATCPNRSSS